MPGLRRGPWFTSSGLGFAVATVAKIRVAADACPTAYAKADADYIAAAHPEAIRALLAERDQYARVLDGLPQDAIDGGWTAAGISAHAKALETENERLRNACEKAIEWLERMGKRRTLFNRVTSRPHTTGASMSTLNYDPTDPDKMRLPQGAACGDCVHIYRCKAMFGHTETDTYCDWSPSRFSPSQVKEQS